MKLKKLRLNLSHSLLSDLTATEISREARHADGAALGRRAHDLLALRRRLLRRRARAGLGRRAGLGLCCRHLADGRLLVLALGARRKNAALLALSKLGLAILLALALRALGARRRGAAASPGRRRLAIVRNEAGAATTTRALDASGLDTHLDCIDLHLYSFQL